MQLWYEAKIRYEKTVDGKIKKVTETYLIDSMSYTEAEARIIKEMAQYISGEYTITSLKRSRIVEIFANESDYADRWYNCKINITMLDESKGIEKKTPQLLLVQADTVQDAWKQLTEGMEGTLSDYTVVGITESPILDYYPYQADETITEKIEADSNEEQSEATPEV